eukprot:139893_1
MRSKLIIHAKRAFTGSDKILSSRNKPTTYAYETLSNVDLDIEPFEDQSHDQNRTESELQKYFSNLRDYVQRRRYAAPKYHNPNKSDKDNIEQPLFKPLYDYSKTKSTEIDQRQPYQKFIQNLQGKNPELYKEMTEALPIDELIDMNYLQLHENRNVPKLLPDNEYPEWVWELVPESRRYWWTDLIQTPFENLSEVEKFQLFRKWRKTLMVSNNMWNKSHLGYLGKVRPRYNDPWPRPLTKMDIHKYQMNDIEYQNAKSDSIQFKRMNTNKKRLESDADYLKNQNLIPDDFEKDNEFVLSEIIDDEGHVMEEQRIDLAKYYGLDGANIDTNVDNDYNKEYGVVFDLKPPLEK